MHSVKLSKTPPRTWREIRSKVQIDRGLRHYKNAGYGLMVSIVVVFFYLAFRFPGDAGELIGIAMALLIGAYLLTFGFIIAPIRRRKRVLLNGEFFRGTITALERPADIWGFTSHPDYLLQAEFLVDGQKKEAVFRSIYRNAYFQKHEDNIQPGQPVWILYDRASDTAMITHELEQEIQPEDSLRS